MKRRIALLAGTFITLLVAYLVYHFSTGGMERLLSGQRVVQREKLLLPPPPPPATTGGPGYDNRGTALRVENRDSKTGRLEGVFFFPRWEKQDDGSYLVEEPNVVIYHKGGERTFVFARSGHIEVEELAKQKFEVRTGELRGGVTIWFDRNPEGPPPSSSRERMRQIVRLYTDDIHLDNDRLIMRTDSRVTLFSDKADVYGNGLIIRWRDVPRELVHLEIPRGGEMHVYETPEDFGAPLPGAGGPGGAPATGRKPSATRPSGRPALRGEGVSPLRVAGVPPARTDGILPAASSTSSYSVAVASSASSGKERRTEETAEETRGRDARDTRGQDVRDTQGRDALATSSPASQARALAGAGSRPTSGKASPPPWSNMYRAEFHGNVRVNYPFVRRDSNSLDQGHIEGADVLALDFEWDANTRRKSSGTAEEEREAQRDRLGPAPGSSSTQSSQPALARATGPGSMPASSALAGTGAATQGSKAKPKETDPMVILWSGPLTLDPYGHTDEPSQRRYEITADGERVILGDSRSIAACRHFRYVSPEQEGELDGNDASPARLLLADGVDVVCAGQIAYQRDRNVALLRGPGYMTARAGISLPEMQALAWMPPSAEPDPNQDSIRWNDSVEAVFASDERGMASGRSIQEANFLGAVKLVQAASGDFVNCDSLQALFGLDESNRPFVRRAVAVGNVSAREQSSQITAGKMVVTLQSAPKGMAATGPALAGRGAGKPDANAALAGRDGSDRSFGSSQFGRLQPVSLEAEGNVVVVDGEGLDRTVAHADRLVSDLIRQTAVLWGSPASILHGENEMIGDKINVKGPTDPNLPDQAAHIDGPGKLVFLVRRDMNGNELKAPRPVRISWTDWMDYPSLRNEALFSGAVRLESNSLTPDECEQDEMTCPSMQVVFAKPQPTSRPTTRQAAEPASGPVAAWPSGSALAMAATSASSQAARPSAPQASGGDLASLPPGLPLLALTETPLMGSTRSAPDASSGPASRPSRSARRGNLSMDSFGQPKVDKIVGNGGVVMRSSTVDPVGHLLRRLQVTGEQLVYEPNQVQVFGKGWMTAEDYRPPDSNRLARASTQPSEDVQRPMQTAFWWDHLMSLSQGEREVVIEGNVQMVSHSGQYVLAEKINAPPWPPLKGGRLMTMRSDRAQVFFAPPEAVSGATGKATGLSMEGGPRIGQPTRFYALGGVRLVDGFRKINEINGQQVEFTRNPDIVRVWGYMPGQPKASAVMSFKDPDAGPYGKRDPIVSPRIIWYRATDRIEAEDVSAGGSK
jgi:lipopolysaccharide export system protein LptA